jgi:4-hydroxybenzoate polyprenyltransferase
MGAAPAHRVARSRPRAYLALARVSNLPTIWTNVLAGSVLATTSPDVRTIVPIAVAISLLYSGGMFLNDAFDARFDAANQPYRPIPAGEATLGETFFVGFVLLAGGVILLFAAAPDAALWALALAGCIVLYDWRHKGNPVAPLIMGVCRGLVYCTAGAAAGAVTGSVFIGAAIITAYVVALTLVAKYGGQRWGWSMTWLIAGICLVDAIAIASTGFFGLAGLAALGFPTTLIAQRLVRGT